MLNTTIKINFDAAYDPQQFRSRSGMVVRNDRGKVLASKFVFHKDVASSFAVEALACSQAVQLGESMGLAILVIEGDAL